VTTAPAFETDSPQGPLELDAETCAALEWPALLAAIGGFCTSSAGKARALALKPAVELWRSGWPVPESVGVVVSQQTAACGSST
jgi:hypothetical protein